MAVGISEFSSQFVKATLTPTGNLWILPDSFLESISAPEFFRPYQTPKLFVLGSLQRRGRGLPLHALAVTEPTSSKPKPTDTTISVSSISLSKPAARPMGFLKC